MSNFPCSLAATIYFSILAIALLALGTQSIRAVVMVALFLGALSQFVMQGDGFNAERNSNVLAYIAMALVLIGIVLFIFE